jgi:transcriptional regulator GlxA family with amidase domain
MVERFDRDVDDLVDTRSIARRQLVASVVTACLVAAAAGLIAVRPASHEAAQVTAHNYPAVRQPVYVEPNERMTAAASNASSAAFDLP